MKLDLGSFQIGSSRLRDAALFVGLTFILTWLFWIPAVLLQSRDAADTARFLLAIGSFVPLAVAFWLNRWAGRPTFYWQRWLKTLGMSSIIVALVLPVLLLLPIILLRLYLKTIDLGQSLQDARGLTAIVPLLLIAFGEEVGWRGFLLARLRGLNLVLVNVIIGALWFLWLLPQLITPPADSPYESATVSISAFFVFAMLITPFFNRLALQSGLNVLLPTILRASLSTVFTIYLLQPPLDFLTHPYGLGVLAWLAALNLFLFAQLWRGKRRGEESELERIMPFEAAVE